MKHILFLPILFLLYTNIFASNFKTTLTGKVTDQKTGEPIIGVSIYLPDLKTGTVTDTQGNYTLQDLPNLKTIMQVSFVGYRTLVQNIDLNTETFKNFVLEYVATEMNEVVITGLSKAAEQKRTPTPMSIVSKEALLRGSSTNIIDAIATQPGVAQITTGSGISKPVIRGLGYNRVVTVQDEIRQEGQQWGDEHGIEIDENSVSKVEILKGPASLAYGSDALAGVIHFISAPSLPNGKIAGNVTANYQTNNGLFGYSADVAGNNRGLIWDLRYSNKKAHAYKNKYDGYALNSGFNENALSGLVGLHKSWGYTHLKFSVYNLTPGIIEGERDSLTGKFIKFGEDGTPQIASNDDLTSYSPATPFQKIGHYKVVLNSNIVAGGGTIKSTFGFQQNHRKEFGEDPNNYGLYFLLNTLHYDVKYNLPEIKTFDISFGVNGMQQTSRNKGEEYLVPEYGLFDFGVFTIIHKQLGDFDLSGGIRYDIRSEKGKDLFLNDEGVKVDVPNNTDIQRFKSFTSTFSGISGSMGVTWQISKVIYTKLNLSRGYRAPNIGELGSNGEHEGTLRYELGDPSLKPEYSLQFDYTLGLSTEHISAEATAFYNTIDNFIYLHKLNSMVGTDSLIDNNPVFKFGAGNATLLGGEIRFDIHPHPLDWLHFENTFSFVSSTLNNQPDSSRYLPFTPAPKLQSAIKAEIPKIIKGLGNAYVKFEVDYCFKQNNYYAAYGTETGTPAYTLLNIGLGTDVLWASKTLCSVYISLNNIADVGYQSHLSRLKYAPENYATGRMGVYNMGRNITFKVFVPLEFK